MNYLEENEEKEDDIENGVEEPRCLESYHKRLAKCESFMELSRCFQAIKDELGAESFSKIEKILLKKVTDRLKEVSD